MIRHAVLRLRALFRRDALDDEMQAEMRQHLERATERLVARGLSREEAWLMARREFGNAPLIHEEARAARGMRWIDSFRGDLQFAMRHFARNKGTVAIIVAVFALGIGANTALVTTIQSQLWRPAPGVPDDDALILIRPEQRDTRAAAWDNRGFTYKELQFLAEQRETFSHVAGWLAHDVILVTGDSVGARGVRAQFVTPGYFEALGVGVVAGTGFTVREGDGADFSAVMAFERAERLFGNPATAVGRRVLVNGLPVRIAGITPPAFQGALRNMDRPALFIPISARADLARVPARWLVDEPSLEGFARLAPDVPRERAATLAQLAVTRTLPDSAERVGMARTVKVHSLHAMLPESEEMKLIFGALTLLGVLLLLVTCTNVSSLMVAAAVARRQEIAVRLALGAARTRILRQLVTEATLLAVAGGIAGMLVCWWGLELLAGYGGSVDGNSVMPDATTFAVTMGIAVATGIVFGLSPALHATRAGMSIALRDSGAGVSRQSRLQRGFVLAQIVFSLPLLVALGATLSVLISDHEPHRSEVSTRIIRVTFRPLYNTGAPEHRREAVDSVAPRLAAHPEITAVVPEMSWVMMRRFLSPTPGTTGAQDTTLTTLSVMGTAPGRFAMLDIPIVLGRDVTLADTAAREWPVVISSNLARGLWGDANPIGRTFASPGAKDSVAMTVVGVYDASRASTGGGDSLDVFTAHGKQWRQEALLIRTRGDAEAFMPTLRPLIRSLAPELPVAAMLTLAHEDEQKRTENITIGVAIGGAGALALLLASLGLYGVIALAVRQRTREIGIRIALGARPASVARMFLGSGVRIGVIALLIGLPLSFVGLKIMMSQAGLFAPELDIWKVGAVVAATLLAVSAGATWLPARRAAAVDPVQTLRVD